MSSEFYGDRINRFFFGMVINNNDEDLHLGRCQVRIWGIHGDEVPSGELPWAQVLLPTTEPGTNGNGANPMLAIGAQVFGVFLDGKDSQLPMILGSVPRILNPSQDQQINSGQSPIPTASSSSSSDYGYSTSASSTSARAVAVGSLKGSTNAEKAFNFFTKNGFTPEQASGIVGNLATESGIKIDPEAFNKAGGGKGAYGIAQWRATRQTGLDVYANMIHRPRNLLETQLGYILWELTTTEKRAGQKIREAKSAKDAALLWDKYYERSGGSALDKRIAYAEDSYARFA
jgi:hypothetical protein|tara:strand:+ start:7102 stop:7965 length:864 start_codon:yes stop_codon:yes gene_type:complete